MAAPRRIFVTLETKSLERLVVDIADLLKQAKLPERTVELCLRGDLQAEFELLDRQLQEAREREPSSMGDDGGAAVAAQIEDLRQQMKEAMITFRLRALPRRRFAELLTNYPPREGNRQDQLAGANVDEFSEAVVPLSNY